MRGEVPSGFDISKADDTKYNESQQVAAEQGPDAEARRQEMARWAEKAGAYAESVATQFRQMAANIQAEGAAAGLSEDGVNQYLDASLTHASRTAAERGVSPQGGPGDSIGPLQPRAALENGGYPDRNTASSDQQYTRTAGAYPPVGVRPEEKGMSYAETTVSPGTRENPGEVSTEIKIDRSPAHITEEAHPETRPDRKYKGASYSGSEPQAEQAPEWNEDLDAEIQHAAGRLYGEAMGDGTEIVWNDVQKGFSSADWAEARRRASEMLHPQRKSKEEDVQAQEAPA